MFNKDVLTMSPEYTEHLAMNLLIAAWKAKQS